MAETGLAFLVALVGGLFPVISVEVYLVGATALLGDAHVVAMALAAGIGQTLGKIPYYYLGRGALRLPWLQRRADRSVNSGKWAKRMSAWREKAEDRPWWTVGTVLLSALVSLPPYMLMCVLAGTVRMNPVAFAAVSLLGRSVRFLFVVFVPGTALALLT